MNLNKFHYTPNLARINGIIHTSTYVKTKIIKKKDLQRKDTHIFLKGHITLGVIVVIQRPREDVHLGFFLNGLLQVKIESLWKKNDWENFLENHWST